MTFKIFEDLPDYIGDSDAPWQDENCISKDYHVAIYRDKYPVSSGHLLFVPRHNSVPILAEAFEAAVRYGQERVRLEEWDAFNIGLNYGSVAGQTVAWPHIHLIPRYKDDVDNPRGGVRNILQNGLGDYTVSAKLDPNGGN